MVYEKYNKSIERISFCSFLHHGFRDILYSELFRIKKTYMYRTQSLLYTHTDKRN